MPVFEFSLVTSADESIEHAVLEDALFEAGCDDALLVRRDSVWSLDFDREAETLLEAVMSAIEDVEHARVSLSVLRVEPDELVTASQIAERTGRSKESIRLLAAGRRGRGGFPVPVRGATSRTRLWRWSEVAAWMATHDESGDDKSVERARTITTINAALELRRSRKAIVDQVLERLAG